MTITVSVRVRPPAKKRKKSESQHVKVSQDGRTLFVSRNPQLIQQGGDRRFLFFFFSFSGIHFFLFGWGR